VIMAEAPHGTAPSLFGKNIANPMAMIMACASLLAHHPERPYQTASRAIYEATLEAVMSGIRTADLGGGTTTSEFTDEVIRRVQTKLEVWSTLGESR
ncbi:MAG: isocitrate dehydrogenase, partial [Alicyclobacillus sp.]|nr:isocitrate dehydrogenase [Alicyclobacillus sp.]